MHELDPALNALAERQHGLVARRQVDALGMTRRAWRHRLQRGDWETVTDRVARRTGSPPTERQTALAYVLDAGPSAYVSHHSAAALWDMPGFRLQPVHVMTARAGRVRSPLATLHLPRHLPDPFATTLDEVPVVRPSLLLLQLAAVVHPARLLRLFDGLWSRRLLSARSVRAELDALMHRGRPGTAALRALLDSLPADYTPTASGLESRFASIVADHALPRMRRQVDLGDHERWCGRVDFVAVDLPLVVEVDSDRFHRALSNEADDAERQRRLEEAGFVVVRVNERQVWHRPAEVVADVRWGTWEARSRRAA